jgi:predicted ArsR family transcriptional regulator
MDNRLFASSRGRIIGLLRRAGQTVNDLAASLGLTDNAVRANLARLERDGLVRQAGSRPSFRKPETVYDITAEAERLFARAYGPLLDALIGVLEAKLPEADLDSHLREVGRRLAAPHLEALSGVPPAERAAEAVKILEALGGSAELAGRGGDLLIRGFACPFSQVVPSRPKLCVVAEAMVSELLGREVREECQRGERPACCFRVA